MEPTSIEEARELYKYHLEVIKDLKAKADALADAIQEWRDKLPSSSSYDGTRRVYDKLLADYRGTE